MGAEDVEVEGVIGVRDAVRPGFGRGSGLGESGGHDPFLAFHPRSFRSHDVEELPPRHRHEPAPPVTGRVGPPRSQGFDERVLNGILGGREVCSTTDEDADHGGDELTQLRLGEGIRIGHRGLRSRP